jgi:hypothetical protein
MRSDALSWCTKVKLEAGDVVVLETAGRAGHWNPPRHILMTSGGVTPQQQWREVDDFPLNSILKFFQVDNAGMLLMTSSARYCKEGVGSRRPN